MIKLTSFSNDSNWVRGKVDDLDFCAKLYDEPSRFGIDDGRVSKLWVDGVVNYDRGWDFGEEEPCVGDLVNFLESTPKRWEEEE